MAKEVNIPEIKEILQTGLQFGHSTSRWNPRMAKYIFGIRNGIHIIDIVQTRELLSEAADYVSEAAGRGKVIFVGSKKQAGDIIRDAAVEAGAHFVDKRWAGGLFTNFPTVRKSIQRLNELERMFEEGVEGRTKYEVSRMKVEWAKLDRLYGGVKTMEELPTVMVVIDPRYEKVAVREARKMRVPVIGLVDTNCDPRMVDYIIPGNDDALRSIELVINTLAEAVKAGHKGKGVKHNFKDYSSSEIKIVKLEEEHNKDEEVSTGETPKVEPKTEAPKKRVRSKKGSKDAGKGILEIAKERSTKKSKSNIKKK